MTIPSIQTSRLLLRKLNPDDARDMFLMDSDPEVHQYLGNNPIQHIEESEEILRHVEKQYEEFGIGRLAIIVRSSGNFAGWAGLKYETKLRPDFPYYDVGYRLKQAFWRNGYGTEASLASLQFGFHTLGLSEIYGAAHPENVASNKILNNIGLQPKGTFRYDNVDMNWYGATKETWKVPEKQEGYLAHFKII